MRATSVEGAMSCMTTCDGDNDNVEVLTQQGMVHRGKGYYVYVRAYTHTSP